MLWARMQAQLDLLDRSRDTLTQARRTAQQRQSEAQTRQDAWAAHPLYPAEETQLRQQAEAMTPPTMPGPVLPISAAVLLCAAAAAFALLAAPARFIAAVCGAAAAAGLFLYYMVSRRRIAARQQTVRAQRTALERQTAAYLELRAAARQAQEQSRQATAAANSLALQLQGQLVTLLAQGPAVPSRNRRSRRASGLSSPTPSASETRWTVPLPASGMPGFAANC